MMHAEKTIKTNSHSSFINKKGSDPLFFQPKLKVGKPNDKYELEADKMAEKVIKEPLVDEENMIRKQEEEEEIQKKPNEEEEMVQSKSDKSTAVPSGFVSGLNSSKGSGSKLSSSVQNKMESGFGTDFSNVRIHTNSNAVQLNRQIGAQAFTHGNDIYFNEGKYNPTTKSGQNLIAHELTHTIQQGASVQPKLVQKKDDADKTEVPDKGDNYDFSGKNRNIFIDKLPIPSFKRKFITESNNFRAHEFSKGGREDENDPEQSKVWDENVKHDNIRQKLIDGGLQKDRLYRISATIAAGGKKKNFERNGDVDLIAPLLKVPFWVSSSGEKEYFQIDHKEELQQKGWPRKKEAGKIDNLFLLSAEANRNSGNIIRKNVDKEIQDLIRTDEALRTALASKGIDVSKINVKLANNVKSEFDIYYKSYTDCSDPSAISTWDKSSIEKGDHIEALLKRQKGKGKVSLYDFQDPKPNPLLPFDVHPANMDLANQIGSSSSYVIYWGDNLSSRTKTGWDKPDEITKKLSSDMFNPRLTIHSKFFNAKEMEFNPLIKEGKIGHMGGEPFKFKKGKIKEILILPDFFKWPIIKMPGTTYAGYLLSSDLKNFINNSKAEFALLSPFTIDYLQITENGLYARGILTPSVPFISKANIEIIITEDDVRLYKLFSTSDLEIPSPFSIHDVTLSMGYGLKNGFFIDGIVNFGIDGVGDGFIGAAASSTGGLELEGEFNFDSELFDPASINVSYKDETWTIGGKIGIPKGKIRGITNASITAEYSEGTLTASGEAELDIPGIKNGKMDVIYGEKGFSVSGDFDLKDDIPGIKGGNVTATIARNEGDEGYSVTATGTAQPDIQGINSTLKVTYENGAFSIMGIADYNRGMLSGNITVGVANRSDENNDKAVAKDSNKLRLYGGGSLSLTLTPWLKATAGVQFLENGELEVIGKIGLPGTVDIFDRKSIDRNLFTVPAIEIPIFAIPIGPKSIGIVARITGGLDFSAGFGPGQLRKLEAEVKYNPDKEEETTVTGSGLFVIPADAGLTLRGDLGLGASVAIASLTGGIELAGELGLAGEASAAVIINWSPQAGFVMDASGSIMANPKFSFEVNAFARASLDLWIKTLSKTWRHNLAAFTWGPDIMFGIIFPIHYKEGEAFDISFDDIRVIYPNLDLVKTSIGLARDVKEKIF